MKVEIDGVRYVPHRKTPKDADLMDKTLDTIMEESEAGDGITVRQYFAILLKMVWEETEAFDGKRPFGNSGWGNEVYDACVSTGYMTDGEDGNPKILDLIQYMCCGK